MLQAISSQGDFLILASLSQDQINQLKKSQTSFYCPICKKPLVIKAGLRNIPHFAHQSTENCPNRAQGEGVYHERGKLDLYYWLKEQGYHVELEYYLKPIKQRADLIIHLAQKKVALEYQCATIPLKEILTRTRGYQSIGVNPIWILGGNRMRRLGKQGLVLPSIEQNYLSQYPKDLKPKMLYYCPNTSQFARFDLASFSSKARAIGQLQYLQINKTSFAEFFHSQTDSNFTSQWLYEKRRFRLKVSKYMSKKERRFREWLYVNQLFPSLISSWVGLPVPSQWQMNTSVWAWQAYLCYDFFNKNPVFSHQQLMTFIDPYRKNRSKQFPLLLREDDPVLIYLNYLIIGKKITRKDGLFYVKGKVIQYQSVEQALKNDRILHSYFKSKYVQSVKKTKMKHNK